MERFAFSLSADSKAWLEDRADELDISQADVIRRCVAQARRSGLDDTPTDTRPESDTASDTDSESLRRRIDELEHRVAAIEQRPHADTEDPRPASDAVDTGDATDTADMIRDRVMAQLGGGRSSHTNDAIVDTITLLRDHGPVATSDIQDLLIDNYADHYSSGRSAWESIRRYVEQIAGVEKPGQGEYTYSPD
jgi:hypothetical protein